MNSLLNQADELNISIDSSIVELKKSNASNLPDIPTKSNESEIEEINVSSDKVIEFTPIAQVLEDHKKEDLKSKFLLFFRNRVGKNCC